MNPKPIPSKITKCGPLGPLLPADDPKKPMKRVNLDPNADYVGNRPPKPVDAKAIRPRRAGFRGLEDIEPITVAAYVEQHPGSPATIKQHMSAIRMLFSWLTEKGILAINPAREIKTETFSCKQDALVEKSVSRCRLRVRRIIAEPN